MRTSRRAATVLLPQVRCQNNCKHLIDVLICPLYQCRLYQIFFEQTCLPTSASGLIVLWSCTPTTMARRKKTPTNCLVCTSPTRQEPSRNSPCDKKFGSVRCDVPSSFPSCAVCQLVGTLLVLGRAVEKTTATDIERT
jgi:hypothetical protein